MATCTCIMLISRRLLMKQSRELLGQRDRTLLQVEPLRMSLAGRWWRAAVAGREGAARQPTMTMTTPTAAQPAWPCPWAGRRGLMLMAELTTSIILQEQLNGNTHHWARYGVTMINTDNILTNILELRSCQCDLRQWRRHGDRGGCEQQE